MVGDRTGGVFPINVRPVTSPMTVCCLADASC
ncbi:MAG: hypothetical protein QOJ09_130 [Actinomycetota bacterium]|nr:hypothetical protein [Actinomycetota bacterium]